ncbi:putative ABC transporter C family member [Trichinella spiralis]|uniref:ABC transporter C family member n=1 Tax=Trichinella spiralis TaxID=6334 RepID=A0ABR3KER4_TRISP
MLPKSLEYPRNNCFAYSSAWCSIISAILLRKGSLNFGDVRNDAQQKLEAQSPLARSNQVKGNYLLLAVNYEAKLVCVVKAASLAKDLGVKSAGRRSVLPLRTYFHILPLVLSISLSIQTNQTT